MSRRRWITWCALALHLSGAARAAPPTVTVTGGSAGDADDVRDAVRRELGADGEGGAIDVRLDASAIEVVARLPDGRVLARTVARPADRAGTAEAAALLAGNLLRDQTSDLEAELRRQRARAVTSVPAPASVPAPKPSAPPPAAPAPGRCSGAARTLPALELAPGAVLPGGAGDPATARAATLALVGGHRGPTHGASVALLGSHGSASVCGVHVSGLWDVSRGWVRGAQLASGVVSATHVDGAQIGLLARASGAVRGAQLGAVTLAEDVSGAQLALVAVARDVAGAQVGLVNVARRARGVQVGLVNVADDSDAPIGLVNVVRRGRLHVDTWLLDLPGVAVGVVHGGRYTHTIYGLGARRDDRGDARVMGTVGFGGHARVGARAFIDLDALTYFLPDRRAKLVANVFQLRVIGGVAVSDGLSLFAGPTASLSQSPPEIAEPLGALGATDLDWGGGAAWRAWPGVTVGARAF